jgi:hypothetical protein
MASNRLRRKILPSAPPREYTHFVRDLELAFEYIHHKEKAT